MHTKKFIIADLIGSLFVTRALKSIGLIINIESKPSKDANKTLLQPLDIVTVCWLTYGGIYKTTFYGAYFNGNCSLL